MSVLAHESLGGYITRVPHYGFCNPSNSCLVPRGKPQEATCDMIPNSWP